ncbi:MAG TPA: HAD family hydrolase [Oceanithermus profundus]|uniref:HAD family hydrolase n=1 Tax=Oceanithermus profundus TaxID=187137 RepID=A0A7C4ZFR4_9DEIN|nr:HAD family hydrolase [Oceanithermus profundus]
MPEEVWVFDVEGTLTTGETWQGVGRWLEQNGRRAAYRRFFLAHLPGAMLAKGGLIDKRRYQNKWMQDLAGLFAGAPEAEVGAMAAWVVDQELWPQQREDVLAELHGGLARGVRVVLASGTYQPVLEAFARRLGPEVEALGTPFVCVDGVCPQNPAGEVNVAAVKARRVREHLGGRAPDRAYGDTASDRYLLELAREAVAVYPDRRLAQLAQERGWRVLSQGSAGGRFG